MNNEKDIAIMLEGKERRKKGRSDGGGWEQIGRQKKIIAFLARYKPEAKFEENSTFSQVMFLIILRYGSHFISFNINSKSQSMFGLV